MAETPDASHLIRRARRRLIGAIALVLLVVIVLPVVLDREPGPIGQDLVIQIPAQDAGKFKTPVLPSAPEPTAAGVAPAVAAKTPAVPPVADRSETRPAPERPTQPPQGPEKSVPPASGVPPATRTEPAPATAADASSRPSGNSTEAARAQALLEGKETWVVPLAAFSSAENAKKLQGRLSAAGIKNFSERVSTAKGEQTRVRAGPFANRDAADKARERLAALGLKPGAAVAR